MTCKVHCIFLDREAEDLERLLYTVEIGEKIYGTSDLNWANQVENENDQDQGGPCLYKRARNSRAIAKPAFIFLGNTEFDGSCFIQRFPYSTSKQVKEITGSLFGKVVK
jgi:hypothetical protein